MELNAPYNETSQQTYTGDPMKPLDDLQNSKVFSFGNDSLTARLGLQLDRMVSSPTMTTAPVAPGRNI